MTKNLAFIVSIFSVLMFTPSFAYANVINTQQARVEHMRTCLSNGGKRDICTCSFDRSITALSAEDLLNVNRALSNKIPANPQHLNTLATVTRRCAADIRNGRYSASNSAQQAAPAAQTPAAPQQLSFEDLDSLTMPQPPSLQKTTPTFETEENTGYFDEEGFDEESERNAAEEAERSRFQNQVNVDSLKSTYKGQYDSLFFQSAAKGDIKAMDAVTQYLPSVDISDASGNTPLMIAAGNGQSRAVKFLISEGADVNHRNREGQQAIHLAVFKKQNELAQFLLSKKADVNSVYGAGFTPLTLAISNNDAALVQTLLIAGAKINHSMDDGNLPIHVAAASDAAQSIQVLKNYGADIDIENGEGYTPLLIAASQNKPAAASALLALGANYRYTDIYGRTPLQIANQLGHQQIVNLILTVQVQQSGGY